MTWWIALYGILFYLTGLAQGRKPGSALWCFPWMGMIAVGLLLHLEVIA